MTAWIERILVAAGLLTLCACGGSGGGSVTTPPPPPPPPPPPTMAPEIDVQRVFPNLDFGPSVALKQAPGDTTRWYVVEQRGVVREFANDPTTNTSSVFVDISQLVDSNFNESGLLGMAFHPNWPNTLEVFLAYTVTGSPLTSHVSRFVSNDGGQTLDPNPDIVLTVQQDNTNHNGGDVAFGPNGNLYASFGDGGGGGDPNENAQNQSNLLGTIVRVFVDGNSPYEIPPDNPFFGGSLCLQGAAAGICSETYAYGLRNPWRMSFDSATGELWTGDVGQGDWEEVDRIVSGGNYGWNDREGAHCFDPPSGCATNFEEPVTEYDHGLGASITGGYVYRGAAITDLVGWYVFGDFVSGRIFAVEADSQPTVAPTELADTALQFSAFAEDANGELYALHYGGTIHQIVEAP